MCFEHPRPFLTCQKVGNHPRGGQTKIPQFLDLPFLAMLGFIKIDPISEIGPIFMGHGGIQQVSAKRTSCGLTQAYLQ